MDVSDAPPSDAPAPRPRAAALAALVVCGLFLAFAVPLIYFSPPGGRAEGDESIYHLPTVLGFARDWPHFDFRNYTSATTPGYHLVLAAVARFVSADLSLLRAVGSVFTVGLLATCAAGLARRGGASTSILICLPLVCSSYVFKAGVWILPENAAWWGLLGVLLLALRPRIDALTYVAGATLLALLVFVRQMHLWSASVLWLAAWLGTPTEDEGPRLAAPLAGRFSRAAMMALATIPAFLIVLYFFHLWGGMVPEHYRLHGQTRTGSVFMDGGNPAAPAMVFTLAALFGAFFLPFAWRRVRVAFGTGGASLWIIAAGALIGAVVAVVPVTTYSEEAGRWSGLWRLVRQLPDFHGRSVLLLVLAPAGGAMLALWLLGLGRRDRWLFLAMWGVFTLAQSFSSMAWQRYYEPFLLMTFALAAVRVDPHRRPPRVASVSLIVLALLQAGVTVMTLRQ
jgi:hypothetical protein